MIQRVAATQITAIERFEVLPVLIALLLSLLATFTGIGSTHSSAAQSVRSTVVPAASSAPAPGSAHALAG